MSVEMNDKKIEQVSGGTSEDYNTAKWMIDMVFNKYAGTGPRADFIAEANSMLRGAVLEPLEMKLLTDYIDWLANQLPE